MKKKCIMAMVCLACSAGMQAQNNIEEILRSVEQHNKELQAQQQLTEAARMEVNLQNSLEGPSVSYSPFFSKDVSGVVSSELVVSQGFDFPTLYAARSKAGKLQHSALNHQQEEVRRTVLLNAKNLCLDLIFLNKKQALLSERGKNADELLALFQKRLEEGDAGVLEVNKIKMERMNVRTEVAQNEVAHRTALQSLLALNGNMPLEFALKDYPAVAPVTDYNAVYDEVMAGDAALLAADAAAQSAAKNVSINRQNWLPKLEVGYRRNTSLGEKSNGFLIGGSLPLFNGRKKVKIAKAQAVGAQYQLDNVRLQAEAQVQSRFNEVQQLQKTLQTYDVPLMYETLGLLKEAVKAGQLSVIEYYTEADAVYRNLQAYMEVENQYQKLIAALYKHRL